MFSTKTHPHIVTNLRGGNFADYHLVLLTLTAFGQKGTKKIKLKNRNTEVKEIYRVTKTNSTKSGQYKYIYKGHKQVIGNYTNGLRNGAWIFTPNRRFKIIGEYINNKKSGNWIYILSNDTLAILHYENGSHYGKQFSYFPSGKVAGEISYVDNKRHGIVKRYYQNGLLKEIRSYKKGVLNGKYESYRDDGTHIYTIDYFEDEPVNLEVHSKGSYPLYYEGNLTKGTGYIRAVKYDPKENATTTLVERNFKDSLLHGRISFRSNYNSDSYTGQFERGFMVGKWEYKNDGQDSTIIREYSIDQQLVTDPDVHYYKNLNQFPALVEKMPEFGPFNSVSDLLRFIGASVKYPSKCKENGITGVVYVSYIVGLDGMSKDVKVVRGVHPLLDAESIKVIKNLPYSQPGIETRMPVPVQYTIPIRYVLN